MINVISHIVRQRISDLWLGGMEGARLLSSRVGTLFLTMFILFPLSSVHAEPTGDSAKVTFHGILKRRPCHLKEDEIDIHFGNVGVHKVDGIKYSQNILYNLVCDEKDPGVTLKMSVRGTATSYDATALITDVPDFGVRITQNLRPMKINDPIDIDYSNPPKLSAVPVQRAGASLSGREFHATATLLAEYE